MPRFRENVLSEHQKDALAALLAAWTEDMLVDAAGLPGNTATTLKSLARRRLVVVEDDTDMPPLWRLTLHGLVEARRACAPQREGEG